MAKEIGKIVEFVSTSKRSFDDALKKAASEVSRREAGVRGFDILKMTTRINNGKIEEYRVNLKVSAEY